MSKMQLYMILFVISTALGFMILYALLPFNVVSKDEPVQETTVEAVDDDDVDEVRLLTPKIRFSQSQLMRSYMNASADPCEDFYEYACGNWEEVNPIPRDSYEHSSTDQLSDKIELQVRELLDEPIGSDAEHPDAVDKAKIFYRSCTDEEAIEERGAQPLLEFIEDLGGWPALDENWNETDFDWIELAAKLSFVDDGVVLAYSIERSIESPENIIYLKQPALGMDNIDYYLKSEHADKLEAYTDLVENVLLLLGADEQTAQNASEEIVKFEARLADAENTPEELKVQPQIVIWNMSRIEEEYNVIEWDRYFFGVQGANVTKDVPIGTQDGPVNWYYERLSENITDIDMETLANYMVWRGVLFVLPTLSADFRRAWFEFKQFSTGQLEPTPTWKSCVRQINSYMGLTTSALFVEKHFNKYTINEVHGMIDNIKEAFEENLSDMDWLGEGSKEYALKKVRAMDASVGYSEYILSEENLNYLHDKVNFVDGEHFENFISITKFFRQEELKKFSKTYDPYYWTDPPITVNAYYIRPANKIMVFAGILQPPNFHYYLPNSLNYGNTGATIGHEVIHGFDDYGRKVDLNGNVANWWTEAEEAAFNEKKECFDEQYRNLSATDIPFDVVSSVTENLADNGGIRIAYIAYHNWKKTFSYPRFIVVDTLPDLDLSEDQLFFLSFAQSYCSAVRPQAADASKYDEHSPSKSRVIGSLMNFKEFSEVFQCPEGSPMNPTKKCRIW